MLILLRYGYYLRTSWLNVRDVSLMAVNMIKFPGASSNSRVTLEFKPWKHEAMALYSIHHSWIP
jgi:hypothetical protein